MSQQHKLSFLEKVGYGSGDFAANLLFHTWNLFLLKFYVDVFGISATAAATMFAVTRILDIVTDPLVGIFADRTQSKWGRYRPWVLMGSIPLGITGYLMFITPDWSSESKLIYAWVSYSLAMLLYTVVQIPYSALMGVMTSDCTERTQLSSYRFFCSFSGQLVVGAVTLWLIGTFSGSEGNIAQGYQLTIGLFMVVATCLYIFTFMTTKERVSGAISDKVDIAGNLKALVTNIGWIVLFVSALFNLMHVAVRNGALLFYFDYYVGDQSKAALFFTVGSLAFLAGIVCTNYVSKRFEKRNLLVCLTSCVALGLFGFYFIPPDQYQTMLAVNVVSSFFAGPIPVLVYVLYADLADYTEWKTGRKVMALIYSTMMIGIKAGLVIGGSLTGYMLGAAGYEANQPQNNQALESIILLVSIIPGTFALLSGLIIIFYPYTHAVMETVEEDLAKRRKTIPNS
ncbi:MFS transporter [Echinimonas agarilytica]|uniref:MFS transporter n=1 Tax=Echinimonas agarilytica TaxID=1215918 RepID=A0AA42B8N4_9GAMM|nr:MFS transporter [Echinimonas agarilytica]MCM2681235.1 MFS transporter [Echinimonas agarilytica]